MKDEHESPRWVFRNGAMAFFGIIVIVGLAIWLGSCASRPRDPVLQKLECELYQGRCR